MKRHILIFSFVSLFIMPIGAFKTTITSSIYANTDAAIESQFNANPSSIIRRVFFANHATSIPDLPNALDEANKIFSRAMDQANIDLIDIKAEVAIASLADPNAVCEVDIIYTDTIESTCDLSLKRLERNSGIVIESPKVIEHLRNGFAIKSQLR